MAWTVIKMGRPAHPEYSTLVEKFQRRIERMAKCSFEVWKEPLSASRLKSLIKSLGEGNSFLILFDEKGKPLGSKDLSSHLQKWKEAGANIFFIIGGPYGLPQELTQMSHRVWTFSKMTFTSDLAWLILAEQIYRAESILAGSGYHHE